MTEPLRRAAACVGVLGVLCLTLLPPEHVHLGVDDEHLAGPAVHRHFAPHQQAPALTHLEHPDEAHYLDPVADIPTQATAFASNPAIPLDAFVLAVPTVSRALRGPDIRVHGPPWARPASPRGPPASV